MIDMKWLLVKLFTKAGSFLLLLGFASTEFILMSGGLGLWYNQQILLAGSVLMALGILLLIIPNNKTETRHNPL